MSLDGRDRAIVALVARFTQLSSAHINELLFSDVQSHTPCDRALLRLTNQHYLARIERRIVGGNKGGSGQYVYQLGRRGYYLLYEGRYNPARAINYHTLGIADCCVALKRLERDGRLTIAGFTIEPRVKIGRHQLKPDIFFDLIWNDSRLKLWIEVDMGTQGQRQIREKLERYWHAVNEADVSEWPYFPFTLFVAVDDERAKELQWLIEQGPAEAQRQFKVATRETLPALFQ